MLKTPSSASLLLAACLALAFAADQPADPVWPTKFTQDFDETNYLPIYGTTKTTGSYIYDEEAGAYRIDRANCHSDRYMLETGKCTHIVNAGDRYLIDAKGECCYCCSADHGCGILKHDWMAGAEFVGKVTYPEGDANGVDAFKWNQKGLQDNFYYETTEENPADRTMLDIYQTPDDQMFFHAESKLLSADPELLALPSNCDKKKTCSFFSACTALRASQKFKH